MLGLRLVAVPPVVLAAAAIAMSSPSNAQEAVSAPCRLCATAPGGEEAARTATPLRLEVETRLDFDKVVFDGTGAALIALTPGGIARLSGAATASGARPMPGSVLVRGEPGRAVTIELPTRVQLFGSGDGTLTLDSLVTDLPAFPRIGENGTLSFRFGGDLRLSGDSDGTYHGTVDIIVDYL